MKTEANLCWFPAQLTTVWQKQTVSLGLGANWRKPTQEHGEQRTSTQKAPFLGLNPEPCAVRGQ